MQEGESELLGGRAGVRQREAGADLRVLGGQAHLDRKQSVDNSQE